MKKYIPMFLALTMLLALAACGKNADAPAGSTVNVGSSETAEIANPWTEWPSLGEAVGDAQIDLAVPDQIVGFDTMRYANMGQELIEVDFTSAEAETISIRKGATEADVSGDYTVYDYVGSITVSDQAVTIKGQDEGDLFAASWVQDGHFYSVVSTIVMPSDAMLSLVGEIIGLNAA